MAVAEIRLGDVADVRVDVTIMPMATVLSLVGDVSGTPQGVAPSWRKLVRSGLPARGIEVLTAAVRGRPVEHPALPDAVGVAA